MYKSLCHWSYSPPDGGGVAPLLPPPLFRLLSAVSCRLGWGVAAVPLQPVFLGEVCYG